MSWFMVWNILVNLAVSLTEIYVSAGLVGNKIDSKG